MKLRASDTDFVGPTCRGSTRGARARPAAGEKYRRVRVGEEKRSDVFSRGSGEKPGEGEEAARCRSTDRAKIGLILRGQFHTTQVILPNFSGPRRQKKPCILQSRRNPRIQRIQPGQKAASTPRPSGERGGFRNSLSLAAIYLVGNPPRSPPATFFRATRFGPPLALLRRCIISPTLKGLYCSALQCNDAMMQRQVETTRDRERHLPVPRRKAASPKD
jgi:hypothetical protein